MDDYTTAALANYRMAENDKIVACLIQEAKLTRTDDSTAPTPMAQTNRRFRRFLPKLRPLLHTS